MGNQDEGRARDEQLEALARQCERLARDATAERRHASAAQFYSVAIFLRDCMRTRVRPFTGRATQKQSRHRGPLSKN